MLHSVAVYLRRGYRGDLLLIIYLKSSFVFLKKFFLIQLSQQWDLLGRKTNWGIEMLVPFELWYAISWESAGTGFVARDRIQRQWCGGYLRDRDLLQAETASCWAWFKHAVGLDPSVVHSGPKYLALGLLDLLAAGCPAESEYEAESELASARTPRMKATYSSASQPPRRLRHRLPTGPRHGLRRRPRGGLHRSPKPPPYRWSTALLWTQTPGRRAWAPPTRGSRAWLPWTGASPRLHLRVFPQFMWKITWFVAYDMLPYEAVRWSFSEFFFWTDAFFVPFVIFEVWVLGVARFWAASRVLIYRDDLCFQPHQ
jgi:hypothetical protein